MSLRKDKGKTNDWQTTFLSARTFSHLADKVLELSVHNRPDEDEDNEDEDEDEDEDKDEEEKNFKTKKKVDDLELQSIIELIKVHTKV